MPSSTASCTPRTDLPSTARPCVNHRKNPPNVASLTPTPPSEPLKPSTGATVRDHRNAVRDRSESLSAINRNTCPQSPESAPWDQPSTSTTSEVFPTPCLKQARSSQSWRRANTNNGASLGPIGHLSVASGQVQTSTGHMLYEPFRFRGSHRVFQCQLTTNLELELPLGVTMAIFCGTGGRRRRRSVASQ